MYKSTKNDKMKVKNIYVQIMDLYYSHGLVKGNKG